MNYDYMGIRMDVPADRFYSNDEALPGDRSLGFKQIDFHFHPVGSGVLLDEPKYLITVVIVRLDESRTNEFMNGGSFVFRGSNAFLEDTRTNTPSIYTNTMKRVMKVRGYGRRGNENKYDFAVNIRRDMVCSNGDLLLCGASIFAGDDTFVEPTNDVAAIVHLVESVKPK